MPSRPRRLAPRAPGEQVWRYAAGAPPGVHVKIAGVDGWRWICLTPIGFVGLGDADDGGRALVLVPGSAIVIATREPPPRAVALSVDDLRTVDE